MADEKTYLELSEGDAGSHKFYEVVVSGKTLTIRFGRIGDAGQTQVKPFATPAAALAEATKKIAEKRKKGYAEAVIGERKKRSVTRRGGESHTAAKNVTKAPVIWRFTPKPSRAFGIFIDEARCWMGNEEGAIYSLDHDGRVLDQFKLPDGVKCIVADDQWLYAGCDNGKVYDLGGKVPRVAYEIADDIDIFWLDIKDGVLGVSDEAGNVAVFNHEDESQWKKKSAGNAGWMVRCDELGVYHGHSDGVTMYDWEDGKKLWHSKTDGSVLFGWQEESMVFAATSSNIVQRFTKRGSDPKKYKCDAAVFSCAAAEDGKYVFAGDNSSSVYCFNEAGDRLWKLNTGCGSAYSMQFFKGRLYVVTTDGSFAAIDASEAAIEAAKAGQVPEAKSIKAPKGKAAEPSAEVETTSTAGSGVIVEVYKEGSKLRVRPASAGFNKKWNVQFPKELREVGAKYVVDELRESASGGFYRAHGSDPEARGRMKLVKQTKLVFHEGRSDKVYEIDLCEVGTNQFVVNFRYGKLGAPLKDGSKTVAPVKRDEADRVFDKLVRSKIDSGYVDASTPRPAAAAAPIPTTAARVAPPPPAPGTVPVSRDPRAQKILERLADTGSERRWFRGSTPTPAWPLERAIWRAGELAIKEAEPRLIALIGSASGTDVKTGGKGMRDYCIAWALGRCGGEASVRALGALYADRRTLAHVKRIAAESLLLLSDAASNDEFKDHHVDQLPAPLKAAARTGKPEVFAAALDAFPLHEHAPVLHELYLVDSPTTRPAFLDAIGKSPLRAPLFQSLRYIFKAAELRRDARVFGIFGHRVETTQANYNRGYRRSQEAYGSATRLYLRRRIWRVLRRLGQAGDPDYVKLAAGVLLPFTDADAVEPRETAGSRGRPVYWDRFAPYFAFNHVLYGNSQRYGITRNGKAWRMKSPHRPGAAAPPEREESFPGLWEQNPAALMQLCAESACTPVHDFAGKALLACPAFLAELELDDVLLLLSRPYDATARVGFVVAKQRYDAARPNMQLLAALAACAHQPGRAQAFTWIDEQRALALADSALLAALVMGRAADTRAFARRLLLSSSLAPQVGQVLVGRLVAALLALTEADNELALDAVQTMSTTLASHLTTVSAAVIRDLLSHPLSGVQELGAELLLRHDSRTGLIPADLILAVLHSPHENVRAVGMRLLSELPEAAIASMDLLLIRLCTDANADIRNASRPLIARVAANFPDARDKIVAGLIDSLLRRKLPEDVPSHVLRLLKEDLVKGHLHVDKETIWRLLSSGSAHAQELGGILLSSNLKPGELDLDQIIKLASHEILSVRQAAWSMYEHDLARVQENMASAVRILDAKWEDSRQWAYNFFRGPTFDRTHFTGEVLVGVIDSVRDDVQAFARELLQKHFDEADGPTLLLKLSEHPTRAVQMFATNYLERFASGKPDKLEALMPYFTSVLSRVNQGRIAKHRVLEFLKIEGSRDVPSATIVMPLLFRLAATISIEYRASALEVMMSIHRARPEVPLPVRVKPLRVVAPPRAAGEP